MKKIYIFEHKEKGQELVKAINEDNAWSILEERVGTDLSFEYTLIGTQG